MSSGVTVITPSLPERAQLLVEACASVQTQTLQAEAHLIALDTQREGPAVCRQRLTETAETTLVAYLDDDDLLYESHLAVLVSALRQADADLSFGWHDDGPGVPRFDAWCDEAVALMVSNRNVIPVTVVARRESILAAGGFNPQDRYEDHALFVRMMVMGMRIVCTPETTWRYRIAPNGRTWNP